MLPVRFSHLTERDCRVRGSRPRAQVRRGPTGTPGGEPEAVRVELLGGFRVSVGARVAEEDEWRLRKAASLVKLLALKPGHRLHRERVMDWLWPELDRAAAANNLRYALHVARRVLEPKAISFRYLRLHGDQLILCPDGRLWVDVEAFERAGVTARRTRDPESYRAAVALYAGDLLPGDRYEDWTQSRREELRRLHLTLLVELAGLYEDRGELGTAIEALRRVVASEPTHEEAHVGLMRLYALSGQRHEAFLQYERLEEALSQDLDLMPGTAGWRLYEEIREGRLSSTLPSPANILPAEALDFSRHNLPWVRTSFIGRRREMIEVKRLLGMTGALTLTGTGGCGKTRLALETAREVVGFYPDGVWLVELAPLSDAELVPQAVAAALEVREQPGRPLTDTLIGTLREKDAAGSGQLRASRRRRCSPGNQTPRLMPAPAHSIYQPGASGRRGRDRMAGALPSPTRSATPAGARESGEVRIGTVFRGARPLPAADIRSEPC